MGEACAPSECHGKQVEDRLPALLRLLPLRRRPSCCAEVEDERDRREERGGSEWRWRRKGQIRREWDRVRKRREEENDALCHLLLSLLPLRVRSGEHGRHGGSLVVRGSGGELNRALSTERKRAREEERGESEEEERKRRDDEKNHDNEHSDFVKGRRKGTRIR